MPGLICSGWTRYGTDFITGPSQAAMVAAAVLNPTNFKKSLRDLVLTSSVYSSLRKFLGSFETNS